MFIQPGWLSLQEAATELSSLPAKESLVELCRLLLAGEIEARGIIQHDFEASSLDPSREGQSVQIDAKAWGTAQAYQAVTNNNGTIILEYYPFRLLPVIEELEMLFRITPKKSRDVVVGPRTLLHPIPSGYLTFKQIEQTARIWGNEGLISNHVHGLLTPPDTDSMLELLAVGRLRTGGVDTVTGELIALPVSTWRMERNGQPQVIDALLGLTIVPKPGANPCRPIIAVSDLARAVGAIVIPDDPIERPAEWDVIASGERKAEGGKTDKPTDDKVAGFVLGYAAAVYERSGGLAVAKRDPTLAASAEYLPGSSLQAKAARQWLPDKLKNEPPVSAKRA